MAYIHGFVAPVPTANKKAYIEFTRGTAAALKRLGAVQAVECWGVDVPPGKLTSFPLAVKAKAEETVVFSWTLWKSKEDADAVEAKMRAGEIPEFDFKKNPPPFDGKRLIYGGFEPVVDVGEVKDDAGLLYVTGFVWACPVAIKEKYIAFNTSMAEAMLKLGALKVMDCWGVDVPEGEVTSFPMAVKRKPDEAVVFAWAMWPSKAVADAAIAKMQAGEAEMPEIKPDESDAVFDASRMIHAGFEMVVRV